MSNIFLYDKPKIPTVSLESVALRKVIYKNGRYLVQNALFNSYHQAVQEDPTAPQINQNEAANSTAVAYPPVTVESPRDQFTSHYAELADRSAHIDSSRAAVDEARAIIESK